MSETHLEPPLVIFMINAKENTLRKIEIEQDYKHVSYPSRVVSLTQCRIYLLLLISKAHKEYKVNVYVKLNWLYFLKFYVHSFNIV